MTLAPVNFLARAISPRAAGFSGLDALAINDSRTAGLAANTFATLHNQQAVRVFPCSAIAKAVTSDRSSVRREMLRQHAPRTTAAQHIEIASLTRALARTDASQSRQG